MEIRDDDTYEAIGAEYQYQLVARLNAALKRAGASTDLRRSVAEAFIFDMAMLHDQGQVSAGGLECQPVLAFRDEHCLRLPNASFDLHEYALGNVGEYYETDGETS